jgi:hypothetical protein
MDRPPRTCDVLVTHDAPYGLATGRNGQVQGSQRIRELIEHLQPTYHLSGHYHHLNGPRQYGRTESLSLASLVASARWKPEETGLQLGCMATLDTEFGELTPITGKWMHAFPTPFDFSAWFDEWQKESGR